MLAVGVSGVSGGVIRADRCMELHAWQGPRVIFATGNRFWFMLIFIVVVPKALRVARTGIRAARRGEARSSTPPVQSGDVIQNDAPPSADVRPSAFYGFLVVAALGGSRRVHVVSTGENGSVVVLWSAATRADSEASLSSLCVLLLWQLR